MKTSLIAFTAAFALLALSAESDQTIQMIEADALPVYCATADPLSESDSQYAACDDYYHSLPVIECTTDSDCQEKNPALARWTNYQAY